jgi:imidazolonepropionase-like amidohydrolase
MTPKGVLAILPVLVVLAAAPARAEMRALVGATLLDGSGGAPIEDSVVIVDGERIAAVGRQGDVAIPPQAEIVHLEGMTLLPGLVDTHVRLSELGHGNRARWAEAYLPIVDRAVMPAAAEALLAAGVTTARDVGSPLEAAIASRERIASQRIPGPTLQVTGPVLAHEPLPREHARRWAVEGAPRARERIERLVHAGVDVVAVAGAGAMTDAELAAIDQATREAGLTWIAEIESDADIARALGAGCAGLAGLGDGTAGLPPEALSMIRRRVAGGTPVPWSAGASVLTNYEWLRLDPGPLADPRAYEAMAPIVAEDVRRSLADLRTHIDLETPALRRAALPERLGEARTAGATLIVGSDAGEPAHLHARATWQEVEALVTEAHLTPAQAVRAVTLDAATALGLGAETGSIVPGKQADLIAVRGTLMRHIDRLQDVELVIHRGLRYR